LIAAALRRFDLADGQSHRDGTFPSPYTETMSKTRFVYDNARVEIALLSFYRVLYDPKRDEDV
jgi:hypothetical protein